MKQTEGFLLLALICIILLTGCEFTTTAPTNGKVNYLIVGLDYDDLNSTIRKLESCRNDALQLKKVLDQWDSEGGHGYYTGGKKFFFIDGKNASPTRPNTGTGFNRDITECYDYIYNSLTTLMTNASSNELTIISYSGHGLSPGKEGNGGALCMVYENKGTYKTQFYYLGDLLSQINTIPGKKLLLMDSCYSGYAAEAFNLTQNINVTHSSAWASLFAQSTLYDWDNFFVLTAATSQTSSYESIQKHGYFSYALLKSLGWTADDVPFSTPTAKEGNVVLLSSLFTSIKKTLKSNNITKQDVTTNGTSNDVAIYYF
jgi:uncharacterized caspase-like protein